MPLSFFHCPVCFSALIDSKTFLRCPLCERVYPINDGIPDFVLTEVPEISNPNQIWLEREIVAARNVYYTLNHRELQGMTCCIEYISQKAFPGCRILEVGMGTGHFTRWLAEACPVGTEIYSYDISRAMIETARANIGMQPGTTLFRANSRERLPFAPESFDILFIRLAPLGGEGVPNLAAAFSLLRNGGWYYEAGWELPAYDTPWTDWAAQNGYARAALFEWDYSRKVTAAELDALRIERAKIAEAIQKPLPDLADRITRDGENTYLNLHEYLKIACKEARI